MPLFGRIGRPGLLGTAARTAVIAGTATATAGAIRRHQFNRAEQDYEASQYEAQRNQPQPAAVPAVGGVSPVPAQGGTYQAVSDGGGSGGPSESDDLVDQLSRLAALHSQGALSDEEFAAAKAKLVG